VIYLRLGRFAYSFDPVELGFDAAVVFLDLVPELLIEYPK
jgi:hypothetical protein